jgi:acyl dehydratase
MSERPLTGSPAMLPLFARAGVAMVPGASRLPFVGGGGGDVPDDVLTRADVAVDRSRLAAYDRVCGFDLSDTLPPTYPHMLAFPLQMQLMTDSSFPFAVIGLVHIRNEIEQLRPIRDDEELTVRVHAGDLEPHPKGKQFVLHSEVECNAEPVWRSRSTYLRKGGGSGEEKAESGKRKAEVEPAEPNAVWEIPDDIGRRYAKVSGDSNPIHLRRSTAMAFGMPRAIAHGMWTKARCLAALEGQLPDSFTVDVSFKLPVYLPSKVDFRTWEDAPLREFSLRGHKDAKPHLTGNVARR